MPTYKESEATGVLPPPPPPRVGEAVVSSPSFARYAPSTAKRPEGRSRLSRFIFDPRERGQCKEILVGKGGRVPLPVHLSGRPQARLFELLESVKKKYSKSCGNNAHCCSDKGVAFERGGGARVFPHGLGWAGIVGLPPPPQETVSCSPNTFIWLKLSCSKGALRSASTIYG